MNPSLVNKYVIWYLSQSPNIHIIITKTLLTCRVETRNIFRTLQVGPASGKCVVPAPPAVPGGVAVAATCQQRTHLSIGHARGSCFRSVLSDTWQDHTQLVPTSLFVSEFQVKMKAISKKCENNNLSAYYL